MNAFLRSQFNYYSLIWMCHNRKNNGEIDRLYERCSHKGLCIKPGIQERGTGYGERGECEGDIIFREISPNIPGNVLKHSGKCRQTFWGMFSNIPGNIAKHSGECRQIFRGMSSNILGGCCQTFRGMSSNIPGSVT